MDDERNEMDERVIDVADVEVRFDDVVAVDGLDFAVRRGERVAVLGQTGAGKSTLMNLLIGALAPTSGSVRVAGLDPVEDWSAMQGKIAIAFQGPRLLPWRTATGNVAVGLQVLGVGREQRTTKAKDWLRRVNLGDALDRFPSQLSGGMRQRVALARAFAVEPEVLLLDESFSALDEVTASRLRADFLRVAEEARTTSVIVTHSIQEAFELGHRVVVLRKPAVVAHVYTSADHDLSDPYAVAHLRHEVHELMA
ncbi:ABC transporter ATP-binding protein [Pseudonocardia xishanensis]|uniref:ABC transporter ATP-binding protein n=1 Tax=Pseudonocardia xishanensis TaxID=630995 RepID=A0ABP8RWI3_9PSEU